MATDEKLKPRIRLALGQAFEEVVDMIEEIHRQHRELDPKVSQRDSIELTVDTFLETADLPWGAPALLRPAVVAALDSALKAKLVKSGA